jgi:hypothetical protein
VKQYGVLYFLQTRTGWAGKGELGHAEVRHVGFLCDYFTFACV